MKHHHKDFVERHGITTNEQFDELQSYLRLSFTKESNLIKFWRDRKSQFPHLSAAAINILSIPTSSASVERSFSRAKELLGNKQLRTGEDLVESRMILLDNAELFEIFFDEYWLEYF